MSKTRVTCEKGAVAGSEDVMNHFLLRLRPIQVALKDEQRVVLADGRHHCAGFA